MFIGPALAAIVATWLNDGRSGLRRLFKRVLTWQVGFVWYLGIFLIPGAITLISLILSNALLKTAIQIPDLQTVILGFISAFILQFLLNTEELAWRGYTLPRLQAKYGPLKASLILGVIWVVFHIPLFLPKGGHPAGYPFIILVIGGLSLSVIFSWVFNVTNGSVLIVHLLHQSLNAWGEALRVFPVFTNTLYPMLFSMATFVIIAIIIVIVAGSDRLGFPPMLTKEDPASTS